MYQAQFCENFESFTPRENLDSFEMLFLVAQETQECVAKLQQRYTHFYGAVFPQIIYEQENYTRGFIVFFIPKQDHTICIIENMQDPNFEPLDQTMNSYFVFVDGLSKSIDLFLEALFVHTKDGSKIIGGGAGKLTLQQDKVIFDAVGCYQDAALIVSMKRDIGIGVNHGWEKMDGPFVATSTQANYLKEIGYYNGFDFYAHKLQSHGVETLTQENFFSVAKGYPIGMETYDNETIVRDPIAYDANGLLLVGKIEESAIIYILKGEKAQLIEAASQASKLALEDASKEPELLFVVDCISRVLFLEEEFHLELKAINNHMQGINMYGVLTLGEIANNSSRYIDFFNKTCVVGAL